MHELKETIQSIRSDFLRYMQMSAAAGKQVSPCWIRVLLSSPGFVCLLVYRIRYWVNARCEKTQGLLLKCLMRCLDRAEVMFVVMMKTRYSWWPKMGSGTYLSNKGGIIVGAKQCGSGCVIHHTVTIGMDKGKERPEIGDNVWIGPDSVVYGNVKIGNGVVILPSTVLAKSVPDGCVVAGTPGRIVKRDFDNAAYLASPDPYFQG